MGFNLACKWLKVKAHQVSRARTFNPTLHAEECTDKCLLWATLQAILPFTNLIRERNRRVTFMKVTNEMQLYSLIYYS